LSTTGPLHPGKKTPAGGFRTFSRGVRLACLGATLVAVIGFTAPAAAIEVGEADFTFVSDLSAQGFTPFATSASGNASFGMTDGTDLYICYIADNLEAQAQRQQVLIAEIGGEGPDRTVPNIPVVCVLTQ
jgi:hypothetical protein